MSNYVPGGCSSERDRWVLANNRRILVNILSDVQSEYSKVGDKTIRLLLAPEIWADKDVQLQKASEWYGMENIVRWTRTFVESVRIQNDQMEPSRQILIDLLGMVLREYTKCGEEAVRATLVDILDKVKSEYLNGRFGE
jgi:hypothetical protein